MIVILAAILLILAIAFFQVGQGLFSAMITALASIVAAMIAFNYYEPVASALLYTRQPGTADAGVLLALFVVSLFAVLELFNFLLKDNVEMGVWTNRIAGGIMGLIGATVMVGVLLVAIQMLPIAGMLGYKPFNESLTRGEGANRVRIDEAVVGLLKTLSGGSFSGDNSLDKTHSDLLLESFAAVNDAGKNGRIDAPPDALRVKSSNIVKSDESASWYKDVPNPDKADKTQVLVVHAHIDEQAKDEDGVFVLPATQFRLVTKFKQDPLQAGKSYYPVGYLTCSGDPKTWELWTAPADEKSKLPDLTKLLVARNAKAGGLYVDWVYRIGEGETPTYMAFRRVAKAAVPAPPEDGKYTQLADEALEKKGAAQAPAAPQPAKQIKLALKAGSVVRPHSLQVSPKTGKATFIEVAALENTVHLFDLTAGKDMNLAKVIPGAVACTISPDGTQAIVRANDGVYLLNLASMKAVKASDPRTAAYWMGQKVVMSTIEDGNLGHMKTFIPPHGKIEEWQVSGAPLANNAAGNQILAAANPKAPKDPIPSNDLEATVSLVILDSAGHITKEIAPVAGANAPPIASNSLKWAALSSSSKDAAGKAHDKCTVFDVDHKSSTTIDSFAQPIGITDAGLVVAATEPGPDGFTIKTYQNGKTAILVKKVAVAALADNTVYYVTGTADKAVLTSIDLPK